MAQFSVRRAAADGILLIDKPAGLTSHDVVAHVRRRVRPLAKKVGHAGTLDPFATGLLIVVVGKATKVARFFVALRKEYECVLQFGVASDTGDLTGELTPTGARVTREQVEQVIPRFLGRIEQRVPMTSAVKVDGERLYKKAHRGEVVETPVKEVEIDAVEIVDFDEAAQTMRCRIACSKGTYVRQLATDIGEATSAGAHLCQLARTAVGDFRLDEAQPLADFEEAMDAEDAPPGIAGLVPPRRALAFLPTLELPAGQVQGVRNGVRIPGAADQAVCLTFRGDVVAVYQNADDGAGMRPVVIF